MKERRMKKPTGAAPLSPPTATAGPAWPAWIALGAVLVLAVTLGCREIASPDIGFHLNSGRWIAEHGRAPGTETFVYPVLGRPYIDLQWLYQLGLWHACELGGPALLVTGNVALSLATFGLLLIRTRRREGRLPLGAVLLLLVFSLGSEWELRPHVLSWVFLNLVLLALEEYGRGRARAIWMLPVLMLLWANCHALYILGLVAIGCHGAGMMVKAVAVRRWGDFHRFAVVAIISGLVCFVTPYGWQGVRFPFLQFAQLDADSIFKSAASGIAEFQSPLRLNGYSFEGRVVLAKPFLFVQLMLALVPLGYLVMQRRATIAEWARLLLFGYIFLKAQKNLGYFVIATLPVAAAGLSTLAASLIAWWPGMRARPVHPLVAGVFVLTCTGLAWWVFSGGWYRASWSPHRPGFVFNERYLPVAAAKFLATAPPAARVLNSFDQGGWIAFSTRQEVFIDGRTEVNGPDHFREYLALKDPRSLGKQFSLLQPEWVLIPLSVIPQWHEHLALTRQWRLVYADEWNAIYFRAGYAPHVPALAPPSARTGFPAMTESDMDRIMIEAGQRRPAGWLGTLRGEAMYPMTAVRRSAFYLLGRQPHAARNWALEGIMDCKVFFPDAWVNLAYACAILGDHVRAERCIEVLRRRAPGKDTENLAAELQRIRRSPRRST